MEFKHRIITVVVVFILLFTNNIYAHSGGTNSDGCHNDNINGGYHCHNSKSSNSSSNSNSDSGSNILCAALVAGVAYWYLSSNKSKSPRNNITSQPDKKINHIKLLLAPISKTEFDGITIRLSYEF